MTRFERLPAVVLLALGPMLAPASLRADETPPTASPLSTAPLSVDEIATLCGRLGVADYSVREEATQRLIAGGKAVVEKVAAAAEVENLEVALRCLRVLKELYQRPDEETKQAARGALEKLAASRHRSAARRAGEILHPPEAVMPQGRQILLRQMKAQGGGARIFRGGRAATRVQFTNQNGDVTISAEEAGRQVTITHRQEENIVVRVQEAPAAGEKERKTSEYWAKDVGELKKRHPEAHRLFEQYTAGTRRAPLP